VLTVHSGPKPSRPPENFLRTKCPLIKQIRKILKDGGIKIARDQFCIFDRRGDKLKCAFLLDLGVPGVA